MADTKKKANKALIAIIEIDNLNVRTGPGVNFPVTGFFVERGEHKISEKFAGEGSKAGWGRLKSGDGWISLDFVKMK